MLLGILEILREGDTLILLGRRDTGDGPSPITPFTGRERSSSSFNTACCFLLIVLELNLSRLSELQVIRY